MTQFFKNVRALLCALALSASVNAVPQAQAAASSATPTATPAPASSTSFGGGRQLSLLLETGIFKSEFKSFSEALQASQGNRYNQTLKQGSEIIVMNARCADDIFGDKVTFSLYTLSKDVEPLVKFFLDYRVANPTIGNFEQRRRTLTAEIMRLVSIASPRKADCDPVAVALALSKSGAMKLEVDDAQSPLVRAKINDYYLHDELMQSSRFKAVANNIKPSEQRAFWEKYGYNRFSTAQDALNVAVCLTGIKVLIHNGTNFSLYRVNDLNYDYGESDDKLVEVLKTTPIRKGWKIAAIVVGKKLIKVNDPNAKK